ncbi:MAG: hypothetical protein DRI46_14125 [Chloroflexi bacterium]|nr:MAG: hypothetical protein DRI46_14125 [Chloroflexota bacterium]
MESFEVRDGDNIFKLALLQVDADVGRKALSEYNRSFSTAVKSGALLRSALQNHMKEQDVWNDDKETQYELLAKRINDNADKIARGGIKLSVGKECALDSRIARDELRDLITERTSLDTNTAEGQAENARFNFIVSEVTVHDDTGRKFFKNVDDFLSSSTTEVAVESARRMGQLMYGLDSNYENNLPENKFLKKWQFINDDLHLINKQGELIDEEGRLVNSDGYYVNEDGRPIDTDGNLLTEDGELDIVAEPFLDDDGSPLAEPEETSTDETPTDETLPASVNPPKEEEVKTPEKFGVSK